MNDALKQKILERCKLNLPPMHRQTEHDDGKEFMHDELMPVVTELLELVEYQSKALAEWPCDCREIDGHREACIKCQAESTTEATLSRLAGSDHD